MIGIDLVPERKIMKYLEFENLVVSAVATIIKILFPFIFPIKGFLIITIALVACDLVTGIMAAIKRGEKPSSKGIRTTVHKMTAYFIAILLAEGIRVVFVPEISIPYFVAFIIAVAEFKSNIENIEQITNISIWAQIKAKLLK